MVAHVPPGRPATATKIWLALELIMRCGYFTGHVIDVDGGAAF
jgi:hypothetical protein